MRNYLMTTTQVVNPVLTPEFAARVSKTTDVNLFDIHTHLEDVFAGTNVAFITELYSRAAWRLDVQLKNLLKQVARALPKAEGVNSIDSFSEIQNALHEMWNGELNAYETGYEATGPLHTITAIRDVRMAWHGRAQVAETGRGRTYSVLSIETQIASPQKTAITSAQIANFEFEALKLVRGLSDIKMRGEFREAINLGEQLQQLERSKRDSNSAATDEQIDMYMQADDDFKLIQAKRAALSNQAAKAYNHRCTLIEYQEGLHQQWYEAEIKLIELQLHVYDFCAHMMQDVGDEVTAFHELPSSLQTLVCGDACVALDKTLSKFSSKAPTLYATYSLIVDEAKELLQRVIAARCDEASWATTEGSVDAMLARSHARRALHRAAD